MSDIAKNRMLYLVWLKGTYPGLYDAALRGALSNSAAGLSGLGDDTTDTSSTDSGSSWADAFSNLITNVKDIATTYLTSKSQVDMVQMNSTRVSQGLPPLNSNGSVMTAAQLAAAGYSGTQISQIEANMAAANPLLGNVGGIPVWALGLAAVGVLMVMMRKR